MSINNGISRIKIKGLFNKYDYDIPLNKDVSILIGINGSGKTIIMNFIKFIFDPTNKSFEAIQNIPFNYVTFEMLKGSKISLIKSKFKKKNKYFKDNYCFVYADGAMVDELIYSDAYEAVEKMLNRFPEPNILMNYIWKKQRAILKKYNSDLEIAYVGSDDYLGEKWGTLTEKASEYIGNYIFKESNPGPPYMNFEETIDEYKKLIAKPFCTFSNGERHWFSMFYVLDRYINDPSNCVVLIDEPENSLHIVLQEKFLDEVLKYQDPERQVVIATHSPNIISSHYDLIVEKGELNGER